jgi:hypothetical protein
MLRKTVTRLFPGMMAFAIGSAPKVVLACPVCFGALEGPIADATNKAILVLLGITGAVLAGFASFFIYLIRRARIAVPPQPPAERESAGEGAGGDVMEGTA